MGPSPPAPDAAEGAAGRDMLAGRAGRAGRAGCWPSPARAGRAGLPPLELVVDVGLNLAEGGLSLVETRDPMNALGFGGTTGAPARLGTGGTLRAEMRFCIRIAAGTLAETEPVLDDGRGGRIGFCSSSSSSSSYTQLPSAS
mmetsp:Transcript_19971/g.44044  ORF Transcript_19971/g.44044 Transcript_19971/m.44044 type:complete len:142 (-) Transcript_19971:111-536(-)